jgi:UDP-glucose 4-epimerase
MRTVLVTGGAGYIGSVTVRDLLANGYDIVVVDNLVKGRRFAVERNGDFAEKKRRKFFFEKGDLSDRIFLEKVFKDHGISAVVHFAAFTEVGESTVHPELYFYNNIMNTIHLLDAMAGAGVRRMIFSSSAAVYGKAEHIPIRENDRTHPINPYGFTKLMMEKMIRHYQEKFGIEWVALRYFNAAGASADGELGEAHWPESHLIPNAVDKVARGEKVKVFGSDYSTEDGTCLRDYISIMDLAEAHRLALELEGEGLLNRSYNLGSGSGFTVGAIVKEVGRIMGMKAEPEYTERRPGDPDKLVASSEAFQKATGWKLKHSDITSILKTAADWYGKKPEETMEVKPLPFADRDLVKKKITAELADNNVIPETLKQEILGQLRSYGRTT